VRKRELGGTIEIIREEKAHWGRKEKVKNTKRESEGKKEKE